MPKPNMQVKEKPKDLKKSIKELYAYTKPYHLALLASLVLATIGSIFSIIGPDKLREITNLIIEGLTTKIDMVTIKNIAIFLFIIFILSLIFGYLEGFIVTTVTHKFSKRIRIDISTKINRLPLSYFDKTTYGDILSRVTNDVDTMSQAISQSLPTIVSAITLFFGCLIMMFVTNGTMAITAILSSIVGFVFMFIIMGKSQKYFDEQQKEIGALDGHIEEVYSAHNIVKVYNATEMEKKEFDRINNSLFDSARKSQFLSGLMMPIMNFIGNFGYVAVCVVGAILAIDNKIEFGVIVAFMIYVRLFTQPLSQIAQAMTSVQSAGAASERVFEFLNESELVKETNKKYLAKEKVNGEVTFDHVRFGYEKDKTIIKDFSAKVKKGEKIAIVGPTGAGKTTMVNLLMKFYEINAGDIKIDNISIKDLTRENIHELFCMVLQDTWVWNATIKENIIYNSKKVTDKEVENACKVVGLDYFIKTLPNGYDTVLSDVESLSAGQKQLLTIARGMLKKSPLLILDEATSSVDTRTEELVQKAMDKLTEGKTSFIIAHRLSTIKNADLILVMENGNIVEQGTHKELLKKNGAYAELYNSQFETIES